MNVVPLLIEIAARCPGARVTNPCETFRLAEFCGGDGCSTSFWKQLGYDPGLLSIPTSTWWGLQIRTVARYRKEVGAS